MKLINYWSKYIISMLEFTKSEYNALISYNCGIYNPGETQQQMDDKLFTGKNKHLYCFHFDTITTAMAEITNADNLGVTISLYNG